MRLAAQPATGLRLIGALLFAVLLFDSSPFLKRSVWALPVAQTTTETTTAIITASTRVNLRGGPGVTYLILAKLEPGSEVSILTTNSAEGWTRVRVTSTGRTGWVANDLLQPSNSVARSTNASSSLLPTPTPDGASAQILLPTPTATLISTEAFTATTASAAPVAAQPAHTTSGAPVAIIRPANMNVRGGPGTQYAVVSTVRANTRLPVIAYSPNSDWYKVSLDGVEEAWISAALVQQSGSFADLPRLSAEEIPQLPVAAVAPPTEGTTSTAAPAAVAAAPPPAGGGFFAYGIQAHLWQNGDRGAIAGQIHEIGFTWVKQQLRWEFIEDHPGAINWSEADQIIDTMHGNGINVLFSIFTAPQWTRPDKPGSGGPPNDFNLYADFVGKVAARYCGRLGAIEVWNEQNLQREWEGFPLDPAMYMDLLRRTYTASKANCPSILVISGAPTPAGNSPVAVDDVDYLRGMYAHGLAQYSDGIGVHPSGFANTPEATVQDWQAGRYTPPPSHFDHRSFYFRSTMEAYREVMVANGDVNKRLWPTEFGWGSTPTPFPGYEYEAYITEGMQAQYIVRAFLMMREWGWVGVPFLWNLNFNEGEMAAFRVSGRPAFEALKTLPK